MQVSATPQTIVTITSDVKPVKAADQVAAPQDAAIAAAEENLGSREITNVVAKSTAGSAAVQTPVADTVVKLAIDNLVKELAVMVRSRQNILENLPDGLKQLVQQTLNESSGVDVSQGLALLLKAQRGTADKLLNMANLLESAADLPEEAMNVMKSLQGNTAEVLHKLATFLPSQTEVTELAQQVSAKLLSAGQQAVASSTTAGGGQQAQNTMTDKAEANVAGKTIQPEVAVANPGTVVLQSQAEAKAMPLLQTMLEAKVPEQMLQTLAEIVTSEGSTAQTAAASDNASAGKPSQVMVPQPTTGNAVVQAKSGEQAARAPAAAGSTVISTGSELGSTTGSTETTTAQQILTTAAAVKQGLADAVPVRLQPAMLQNIMAALELLNASGESKLPAMTSDVQQNLTSLLETVKGQLEKQVDFRQSVRQAMMDSSTNAVSQTVLADKAQLVMQLLDSSEQEPVLKQAINLAMPLAPPFVQQAVQNSQLPSIWALLTLSHAADAEDSKALEKAGTSLKELAASLQKGIQGSTDSNNGNTTATVAIPLNFGEGVPPYPMYMHIYHQRQYDSSAADRAKYETWIRVCLVTQHIGNVECVFRLHDENLLDVRVNIEDAEGARSFMEDVTSLKEKFTDSPLHLAGISINQVDEDDRAK